jgi:hypothetical protein
MRTAVDFLALLLSFGRRSSTWGSDFRRLFALDDSGRYRLLKMGLRTGQYQVVLETTKMSSLNSHLQVILKAIDALFCVSANECH